MDDNKITENYHNYVASLRELIEIQEQVKKLRKTLNQDFSEAEMENLHYIAREWMDRWKAPMMSLDEWYSEFSEYIGEKDRLYTRRLINLF